MSPSLRSYKMRQPDLFDQQDHEAVDENRPEKLYYADPEKVRRELLLVLEQARAAQTMPWTQEKLRFHRKVFPQMSRWLPEDEAAQLCFEFEEQVKRLLAA